MTCMKEDTLAIMPPSSQIAPVRILEVEIGEPLLPVLAYNQQSGQYYQRAICLVRFHSKSLGIVELQLNGEEMCANEVAQCIWNTLHTQITEHLLQDDLPKVEGLDATGLRCSETPRCIEERRKFLADAPFVSIIIPTHDRPDRLAICIRSLLSLQYPHYEIIIVDNAPSSNATNDFIQQAYHDIDQVSYIREDRAGVSWARNRGMKVAKGEIIAFADDDVVVDPYWLAELVKAFRLTDNIVCVSGLVMPLELETSAQVWFEEYGGFIKGFTKRIFDLKENRAKMPLYPYTAGRFGVGASMAFTAEFLHSVNGFDPCLGGSGPARCGQDIAIFFQVIIRGYKMVYEPASLLYHLHRSDYAGLQHQIYNYGVGLTAYLIKCLFDNPHLIFDFILKIPYGVFFILNNRSPKNRKKSPSYPKDLTKLELQGMLYGPFAYFQSRRLERKKEKELASIEMHTAFTKSRGNIMQ